MSRPRASVLVPVRDAAPLLRRTLPALCAQLAPGDELIVVDDRSVDGSGEVARAFGATVVRAGDDRPGAAAARNAGAARARGEVLVFVDADVLLLPEALPRLVARVARGDAAAAVGAYEPCGRELGVCSQVKDRTIRHHHAAGAGERIGWFWTALSAMRADVFRSLGGFEERLFRSATVEDMELGFRAAAAGHAIVREPGARARHLHRFDLLSLAGNDFRKSRDWARLLASGRAQANAHASTGGREAAALLLSVATLGLALTPAALVPLSGLAWLLRAQLAEAAAEDGLGGAAAHLLLRAALYPVSAAGAAGGVLLGLRDGSGR